MTLAATIITLSLIPIFVGLLGVLGANTQDEFRMGATTAIMGLALLFVGIVGIGYEQEPEPLSQTEMIVAIEQVLRRQGYPSVCEPVSPTEINCTQTVDPNGDL